MRLLLLFSLLLTVCSAPMHAQDTTRFRKYRPSITIGYDTRNAGFLNLGVGITKSTLRGQTPRHPAVQSLSLIRGYNFERQLVAIELEYTNCPAPPFVPGLGLNLNASLTTGAAAWGIKPMVVWDFGFVHLNVGYNVVVQSGIRDVGSGFSVAGYVRVGRLVEGI